MRFALLLVLAALSPAPLFAQTPAQPVGPGPTPARTVTIPEPAPITNGPAAAAPTPSLSIIADGSLKAVLQELAQTWADSLDSSPQVPITLTNAATMRSKIESGATWDLAIDADIGDVKTMTDGGRLVAAGQRSLARNTVVVYGRTALVKDDDLEWFDLIGTEWKKVALGDPDLTASGRVAQRALEKHDLWKDEDRDTFIRAPTETQALQVIEREQADAAFVYKTDLGTLHLAGFDVYPISAEEAPPIFYTAAIFRLAAQPALAQAFIDFCTGETARPIWTKYGFETD
jgi:molybdenum ABC transporter molybdate-binding protein